MLPTESSDPTPRYPGSSIGVFHWQRSGPYGLALAPRPACLPSRAFRTSLTVNGSVGRDFVPLTQRLPTIAPMAASFVAANSSQIPLPFNQYRFFLAPRAPSVVGPPTF